MNIIDKFFLILPFSLISLSFTKCIRERLRLFRLGLTFSISAKNLKVKNLSNCIQPPFLQLLVILLAPYQDQHIY